jgi:hypothetical protein
LVTGKQREEQRLEAGQRAKERLDTERQEKERLEAERQEAEARPRAQAEPASLLALCHDAGRERGRTPGGGPSSARRTLRDGGRAARESVVGG